VMTFHGYLMDAPEKIIPLYNNVVSVCAANGQSGKPIWDTEHSWFDAGAPFGSTTAQQSAWLARFVTLEASLGIARSVWYMWDNFTYGVLFDRIGLVILPPGIAWREVREWLVNAVVGSATVGANNLYTVSVTRADGTGGVIAWCGSAVVTDTVTYTIPAGCTSMRAIDGTYTSVTPGATITLGLSPVLLESQNVMTSAGGTDLSSAFHTYGVKWDATGMTFYLDGAAIGSSVPQTLHAPYDNLFLALGVKFGGKSGPAGGSTPTGNTNALQVSYVRAWQSVSTPTPPAPKLVIADRVQETSTSTGSGSMALQGAQMSYQPFLNVCNVGDTFYGSIIAVDSLGVPSGAWEVGQYTFAVGNSITRNTVYRSSNNNGLVSFGAGSKNIAIDIAATFAQTLLASGTTAPPTPPPTTTRPFIVNASGNQIDTSTLYGGVVFEDDFTSALDTTKWNTHHFNPDYAIKNYDTTTYTDTSTNPPTVRTVCRLWPARDAALDGGAGGLTPNGFFRRDLSTPGAFSMLYGYIEWNAKLLKGQGIFPAMWLFNDGTQQEIDNLECYGLADGLYADANYNITDFTTTCWHVGGGVGDYILNPKNADGTPKTKAREFINGGPPFNPPISGHWHKYGMHWDNSNLIFYFDGKPYLTVPHNGWYNNPMYLLFQLWFGSTAGSPTVANTPQGPTNAFELDWVRVWSLK
jgi:beta-glucanase (GH16 family)